MLLESKQCCHTQENQSERDCIVSSRPRRWNLSFFLECAEPREFYDAV